MIVDILGTAVAVRAPDDLDHELRRALADLALAPGPAAREILLTGASDGTYHLTDSGSVVRTGIDPGLAIATLVWHLNAVAAVATRHLVLHAGCVGGTGAVLIPGGSGAGKSTLVAACIASGAAYLSDELAAIDLHDGRVVPYAKPIGLDGERLVAASEIRAGAAGPPAAAAGIVFPRYRASAPPRTVALDPAWTLGALAAHATNLSSVGAAALPWLAGLACSLPAVQVTYGDASEAVPEVRRAGESGAEVVAVRPLAPITPTTTTVVVGDGLAVFDEIQGRLHVLDPVASVVWASLPDGAAGDDLVEVAVAAAGRLDREGATAVLEHLERCGLLPSRSSDVRPRGSVQGTAAG